MIKTEITSKKDARTRVELCIEDRIDGKRKVIDLALWNKGDDGEEEVTTMYLDFRAAEALEWALNSMRYLLDDEA